MIKKAQMPDFFEGTAPKAPVPSQKNERQPTSVEVPTNTQQQVITSSAISEMQRQLIDVYTTFRSKPEIASMFSNSSESPFFRFMLDRYVKKTQPHGDQFDMNQSPKDLDKPENKLQANNFTQYLEMLKVVGRHTKEGLTSPDGIWGPYTNNALKAICSIANAMTTLSDKLNEKFGFSNQDVAGLEKLVPQTDSDFKNLKEPEKEVLAKRITPLLAKLKLSINDFIVMMTEASHRYSQYISGDKKFNIINPQQQILRKRDIETANALKNNAVLNVSVPDDVADNSGEKHPITYNDLLSKDNFINYLKQNEIEVNGKNAWEGNNYIAVINSIKRQIADLKNASKPNV